MRVVIGWIVCDGQAFRLRSHPKRYGGQTLAETHVGPEIVEAFERVEPGEQPTADPMIRPGSAEIDGKAHRWTLVGGRQVWP